MKEKFNSIYNQLKDKYGEKYKPLVSQKVKKIGMKIFWGWLVISFLQTLLKRSGFESTTAYVLIELLSALIIVILIFIVCYLFSKNFEYWKIAFEFKKEVGEEFWKLVNPNIKYKPNRNEIDSTYVKRELDNMLNQNTNIIDIEDALEFENKKMYTVIYNTEDKKRFNGILVIIENSKNDKNIEEYIKSSSLNMSKDIKKIVEKEDKKYILLDAVEVFKFSNTDYFNEKELYDNYIRFDEIINEKWRKKDEL